MQSSGLAITTGLIFTVIYLAFFVFILWSVYTISRSLESVSETLKQIRDILRERSGPQPPVA
jgi:hypothetical protein